MRGISPSVSAARCHLPHQREAEAGLRGRGPCTSIKHPRRGGVAPPALFAATTKSNRRAARGRPYGVESNLRGIFPSVSAARCHLPHQREARAVLRGRLLCTSIKHPRRGGVAPPALFAATAKSNRRAARGRPYEQPDLPRCVAAASTPPHAARICAKTPRRNPIHQAGAMDGAAAELGDPSTSPPFSSLSSHNNPDPAFPSAARRGSGEGGFAANCLQFGAKTDEVANLTASCPAPDLSESAVLLQKFRAAARNFCPPPLTAWRGWPAFCAARC